MNLEELKAYRDEMAGRMKALASEIADPMALIAELNRLLSDVVTEFKERKGGTWVDGQGEMIQSVVQQALTEAEGKAIERAVGGPDEPLRKQLRDYFLLEGVERYDQGKERYDGLARLGDAESVETVFRAAHDALATEVDDDFNPYALHGLVILARPGPQRERALDFFRGAFEETKKAADDDLVNDRAFSTIGRCLMALGEPGFAPLLYEAIAFAADPEQDYEMNLAASRMAVCLSAMEYDGPLEALESFCAYLDDTYAGETFTLRAHYALWRMQGDGAGAAAYLADPENTKSLGMAATACADLNHKEALPSLKERLGELTNPVTREVFAEAIARLEEQKAEPAVENRMIWMHGYVSRVEMALGAETDNVFQLRASIQTGEPVGRVFEVDDSMPEDV
jgi:hypothetical protein